MITRSIKICPNCKAMNENNDYCKECGTLINIDIARKKVRDEKLAQKKAKIKKPNKFTLFFENAKNHENSIIRGTAKFFYSVWVLGMAIAFGLAMLVLYIAA